MNLIPSHALATVNFLVSKIYCENSVTVKSTSKPLTQARANYPLRNANSLLERGKTTFSGKSTTPYRINNPVKSKISLERVNNPL